MSFLVVVLCTCVLALAQSAPEAPEQVETLSLQGLRIRQPEQPRQPVAVGRKLALIVGVGEGMFDGVAQTPLPVCRFDAAAVRRVLADLGFECTTLIDHPQTPPVDPFSSKAAPEGYPDVDNVHEALRRLAEQAGPDDTVLVYFSSHGGMIDDQAKVILTNGTASVRFIKETLGKSRAIARLALLDCCRTEDSFRPEVTEVRDVHTISACAPHETSQIGVNGLSIFTECFIDAVSDCRSDRNRDGVVELDEVVTFVAGEVPKRAKLQREEEQHPTRTVVDPKAVNPVLGICDAERARVSARTTAFAGPGVTAQRHDWIYSSLMLQKVREGMTFDEVVEAMERKPDEGTDLDETGFGEVFYHDEPKAGDALHLVFEEGKVCQVHTVFGSMCNRPYDAKASREAVLHAMAGGGLTELESAIAGKNASEVIELLGCPTASLVNTDGSGDGSLRYLDVPRPTQLLVIHLTEGRAGATEIHLLEE